jgi:predicted aminopeptidase
VKGLLLLSLILLTQSACSNLSYYAQSIDGQLDLMSKRRPISEVVSQPQTPEELRLELERALEIRDYATLDLELPDNGSYRSYANLERPYAVWSVVAAPELSLQPKTWCFPFAGCVNYRGYFSRNRAETFADKLRGQGYDVVVVGVRAYSTLGWFDDPVLNTMLGRPAHYLPGVIFHELAHQELYVKDDSAFNEAFAVAVEQEGVRRWLDAHGDEEAIDGHNVFRRRQREFLALVLPARKRLEAIYAAPGSDEWKRLEKARVLDELRSEYTRSKERWDEKGVYEHWFTHDLNNARLALVATYHERVAAFESLLTRHDGDLTSFYEACRALAREPPATRSAELNALIE